MKKIWLEHYPVGVPVEIDPDRFSSLGDLLSRTTARFSDRPAFHNLGRTISDPRGEAPGQET